MRVPTARDSEWPGGAFHERLQLLLSGWLTVRVGREQPEKRVAWSQLTPQVAPQQAVGCDHSVVCKLLRMGRTAGGLVPKPRALCPSRRGAERS